MVVALSLSCSGHAVQDTAGPFENILLRRFWKGDRDCLTSEGRLELGRGTLNLYAALVDYGQAFTPRICFLHVLRGQEDGQAGFVEFPQVSHRARRFWGSNPVVGSSKKSRCGSC